MATEAQVDKRVTTFKRRASTLLTSLTRVLDHVELDAPNDDLPLREQETAILDQLASHLFETGLALRRVVNHRRALEERARYELGQRRLDATWLKPPALRVEISPEAPPPPPPAEPAPPPRTRLGPPLANGIPQIIDTARPAPAPPKEVLYTYVVPRNWEPRPEAEILADMDEILASLPGLDPGTHHYDLIRFKKLVCRARRAYHEMTDGHHRMLEPVQQAWRALNALAAEKIPDRRVMPLKLDLVPDSPDFWVQLQDLYDDLAAALDAFTWYQIHRADLRGKEGKEMLEGIAAAQNLFFLLPMRAFGAPGQDDQQKQLFRDLLDVQRETGIQLRPLQDRVPPEQLREMTDDLSSQYFNTRRALEYRRLQAEQLALVLGMLEIADFCHDPKRKHQDAEQLRDALANALELGVSPTTRELRDALLPWVSILAGDERLEKVVSAIEVEIQRRSQAPAELDNKDTLDRSLMDKLAQVKACVQGKKVLILGGEPLPEQMEKLQKLGFGEINWPANATSKPTVAFTAPIQKADLVMLMIRCMGHSLSNSKYLKQIGTPFVRVQGFGLARIILDLHAQLVPAA